VSYLELKDTTANFVHGDVIILSKTKTDLPQNMRKEIALDVVKSFFQCKSEGWEDPIAQ